MAGKSTSESDKSADILLFIFGASKLVQPLIFAGIMFLVARRIPPHTAGDSFGFAQLPGVLGLLAIGAIWGLFMLGGFVQTVVLSLVLRRNRAEFDAFFMINLLIVIVGFVALISVPATSFSALSGFWLAVGVSVLLGIEEIALGAWLLGLDKKRKKENKERN